MLAKKKIGTPRGGLPATEQARKMPEHTGAPLESLVSCVQIHQRVDAAEDVHKHIDGPHVLGAQVSKEFRKGWIVKKGVV